MGLLDLALWLLRRAQAAAGRWEGVVIVLAFPCRSKLTNEDFRKLLMTPRAAPTSAPPSKSRHHE